MCLVTCTTAKLKVAQIINTHYNRGHIKLMLSQHLLCLFIAKLKLLCNICWKTLIIIKFYNKQFHTLIAFTKICFKYSVSFFKKKYIFIFLIWLIKMIYLIHVYVWIMIVWVHTEVKRCTQISRIQIGGCEPLNVPVENWALVHWKSSKCF